MRKKAMSGAALTLLCFCAACALSMDFAPAAVPESLISRAGQALGNLAMSLNTRMLTFTACFAACLALALFLRGKEAEKPGALFHICCALIAGVWLMAQGFQRGNSLAVLKAPAGQLLKSALYLIGSIFLLELAGRALLLFLDSGADLPACGGKLCGLFRRRPFAAYFVCFLIFCLPTWILCYPGYMVTDSYVQLAYYFQIYEFAGQLPPVHTLLIGIPVRIGRAVGSGNLGLYSVVCMQMLCLCALSAYLMKTLDAFGAPRWLKLFAFLTVVISPSHIVQAALVSKDTPYSYAVLLYLLEIVWMFRLGDAYWKSRTHRLLLALSIVMTMLLRQNGKYLIYVCTLVYGIVLLVRSRRGGGERRSLRSALVFFLCPIVLALAIAKAVDLRYDIIPGSRREALSVPFQQTARCLIHHGDDVTAEEYEAINAILDCEEITKYYWPMDSSGVKQFYRDETGIPELMRYFGAWLRMGLRHPMTYLEATMNQNYPLFSPWMVWTKDHGRTDSPRHTHISGPLGLHDVNVADDLEDFLRGLDEVLCMLPFPGLCVNSAGTTLLLILLCCGAIRRRRWEFLLYTLPGLLTVGTIFLAPVVDPRFIFPASYGMPLVVCLYRNLCRTGKAGDKTVNAA
ncbi:MAG: DUF6020 family protein [Eubacteriales bacterium]|nr:DUF6020 family protein [Eubacteriales bacterium]